MDDSLMNASVKNARSFSTMPELLARQAGQYAQAPAIEAPDRKALSYKGLHEQVARTADHLVSAGVCTTGRVALLLPNGPDMAVAFLAAASVACAAPLNPAYRSRELEFYFSDLRPGVLLIDSGLESPARELAIAQGITVIELTPDEQTAGLFSLSTPEAVRNDRNNEAVDSQSTALILHTSGTTSKPKQVPLSHENIAASVANILDVLQLDATDCGLNIMPLFHIHGLVAGLLTPLASGGRVVCSPGLDPDNFLDWMTDFSPTWYSAVPTMHQVILEHLQSHDLRPGDSGLRFIRSSSAALAPRVLEELESYFHCPVIEAYGMTEAAHQIASNPLPPLQHKPGSVGPAAGPDIAIMDNGGSLLSQGSTGEIVVRGTNVTAGYTGNPQANRDSFLDGWFRTGDQGHIDADGYLFITGRLKEIINRGGDNIQPREIDEALMEIDGIRQAIAFARPHPTLGEDVAAAVVISDESELTETDIRRLAFEKLADFKVPSQVVIIEEIPRGATGKLQRIGLADRLDEQLRGQLNAPRDSLEQAIHEIFSEVLGKDTFGINDNFFSLGGDSITGTQVITRIASSVQVNLPAVTLFHKPTIAELATHIKTTTDYQAADSLSDILSELDKLTDEETQELLNSLGN